MWVECSVDVAGPGADGAIYIWLKDKEGTMNGWYVAHDNVKREMLDVALTAISTNKWVQVGIYDKTPYSVIYNLYLRRVPV